MKKVSILIVTIFVSLACFARGGFGVEINVIPPKTGIDNPISFTDGLKLRGFLSKSFAVRGAFSLSINPTTNYYNSIAGMGGQIFVYEEKANVTAFSITPGIEYHFVKLEKTSVYAGVEVGFGQQKASYKATREDNNWIAEIIGSDNNGKRSNTSIKSGVFIGMDYYITNHLYVGTELGFKYNSIKEKEIITKDIHPVTGESSIEGINKDYSKREEFGCVPSLRLGWTF